MFITITETAASLLVPDSSIGPAVRVSTMT
jgi:hypothetical protein